MKLNGFGQIIDEEPPDPTRNSSYEIYFKKFHTMTMRETNLTAFDLDKCEKIFERGLQDISK